MVDARQLLGTWKMVSWKREVIATGELIDALGPDPVGYINYCSDGRMYAIVIRKDRPSPVASLPSTEEKVRLFDSMLAYAGTYTLFEDRVVHHVDTSWNQVWSGMDQVRYFKFDGDTLVISGAPAADPHTGEQVIHRIAFRKVSPGQQW